MKKVRKTYKVYLQEQGYTESTIDSYVRACEKFRGWCQFKECKPKYIDYKTCLEYVQEIQRPFNTKNISKRTVQSQVGALKKFFNFLMEESYRTDNPIESVNIRGVRRTLNHDLLEIEELEDLFYSYPTQNIKPPNCPHVAIRNKVIVGLMVYQGLDAQLLLKLKLEHVRLDNRTIYIPRTRKANGRELELKPPQMQSLVQYLERDRNILQEKIDCYTEALFPLNSDRPSILLSSLFKRLKHINFKVKDNKQIRASVITYWLRIYNIRKTQYLIGHRYISSTERYLQNDMESLQEMITLGHPIS